MAGFIWLTRFDSRAKRPCALQGVGHIIKAGPTLETLAKNDLAEPCLATPAISQGVLYFRRPASLIAIK